MWPTVTNVLFAGLNFPELRTVNFLQGRSFPDFPFQFFMSFLRSIFNWLPIRILDRYLARQVLISTFIAVAVLSVILVLGTVFRVMADGLTSGMLTLNQIPGLGCGIRSVSRCRLQFRGGF